MLVGAVSVLWMNWSAVFGAAHEARARQHHWQSALRFEANVGQASAPVRFLARGQGYALFLTPVEAVFAFHHSGGALHLALAGANGQSCMEGGDELPGVANYFTGADPRQWRAGVRAHGKVTCRDVYPGIDLVYYGNQRELEHDFIVHPGADADVIAWEFRGAEDVAPDFGGGLLVRLPGGNVAWRPPIAYQEIAGVRREVACRYAMRDGGRVGFALGDYDCDQPLTIDPVLVYSTYLGGGDFDEANAIAVDRNGNTYIAGQTTSLDFPVSGPMGGSLSGGSDVFITKLNSNGTALVFSAYLGGGGDEAALGVALDANNNVYLTGYTDSENFPLTNELQSALGGDLGLSDAFVVKLAASGTALLYATYMGGPEEETGRAIAVDADGRACVAGSTLSEAEFPVKNPFQPAPGGFTDAFVAKFNPTLAGAASLVYASWLGGSEEDAANGIAVDSSGNAYVTGETSFLTDVPNFPTMNAFQSSYGGGASDGFIAGINAAGSALIFSTYVGGGSDELAAGIAVDGSNRVYVTGMTTSTDFPTMNAAQPVIGGGGFFFSSDAFVLKLGVGGSNLLYSTFLGGRFNDSGADISVDPDGLVAVTGETTSPDFPVTPGALQPLYQGGVSDAFLALFNTSAPGLDSLLHASYFGGPSEDSGTSVALDLNGNAYVAGRTSSTNLFPITSGVVQPSAGGETDAFVTKLSAPLPELRIASQPPGVLLSWPTLPAGYQLQVNSNLASANWIGVTNLPTASNGRYSVALPGVVGNNFYRLHRP